MSMTLDACHSSVVDLALYSDSPPKRKGGSGPPFPLVVLKGGSGDETSVNLALYSDSPPLVMCRKEPWCEACMRNLI